MVEVVAAATALVRQFSAANRRAGGVRENPSLGATPGRVSAAASAQASQEVLERIARAAEALVGLFAEAYGLENPLDGDDDEDDDGEDSP
jgi:hypothetical protein